MRQPPLPGAFDLRVTAVAGLTASAADDLDWQAIPADWNSATVGRTNAAWADLDVGHVAALCLRQGAKSHGAATTYDAAGRTLTEAVLGRNGTPAAATTDTYDSAGPLPEGHRNTMHEALIRANDQVGWFLP